MSIIFILLGTWALYGAFRQGYRAIVWKQKGAAALAWGLLLVAVILLAVGGAFR